MHEVNTNLIILFDSCTPNGISRLLNLVHETLLTPKPLFPCPDGTKYFTLTPNPYFPCPDGTKNFALTQSLASQRNRTSMKKSSTGAKAAMPECIDQLNNNHEQGSLNTMKKYFIIALAAITLAAWVKEVSGVSTKM